MKKKVLVVEDEIIVAMDLQITLIDLGYDVSDILTSGEAAVQKAAELKPDLVLMDIHLSTAMDGIDAAAKITHDLAIPVIYLTAYADEETLERARKTAPFGYILKPFEAKELKANLEIAFYKHRLEQSSQEHRQWLLAVLNSISEAVVASDTNGQIKFMNPVAEGLTGWQQEEAINHNLAQVFNFVNSHTGQAVENPILIALRKGQVVGLPEDTVLQSRQGGETPVADSASPIHDQRGIAWGAVMVFRDITEQKRSQAQLEHSAHHDPLTNLPNRTLFLKRLQQAIDQTRQLRSQGFAIMLLDLDRFKAINDTLGHLLGDQMLVAAAARLQAQIRPIDTVARFGGDEFAILLDGVESKAVACDIAGQILAALKPPFWVDGHELLVSASIGIVLSSIPYEQVTDLLQDADIAMYRAKAQGRGCYEVFDDTMHSQARISLQLEQDLRQAIAHQDLQVYYQSIVWLQTRQVVSLEALVRWPHPAGQLIPPAEFIPIAEEVGLVTAIDQWVLGMSCHQLQTWQQQFGRQGWYTDSSQILRLGSAPIDQPELTISVNLSSKQFRQQNLVERFAQTLEQAGLSGHHLKLEVTESVFIENAEAAATVLSQLKDLGVQICLDDFGTGYSSLSYLHKFPIDIVKIDRSFIQDIETDGEKFEIVRAIIALSHNLKMNVTAEGIETPEQATLLQEIGCDYGQGYLFTPPWPGTIITQMLQSSTRETR